MTLTNGTDVISRLSGTSLAEIITILRHRARSNGRTQMTVGVNVSWLGYRWASYSAGPVGPIANFTLILCKEGEKVKWVADGLSRSSIKRASTLHEAQHRFKCEADKHAMSDLVHARARLTNVEYINAEEKAALEAKIKALDAYVLKSGKSLPGEQRRNPSSLPTLGPGECGLAYL